MPHPRASILTLVALACAFAESAAVLSSTTVPSPSVSSASLPTAASTQIIDVNGPITGVLNATAWALIYTYPLYIFGNFAGNVLRNVGVNQILHQRNLASPSSPGVIKPNIDTLYSRVVLDLSKSDLVLTVPNISDGRYWVYPVYDAFGNNVAEIGIVNGNKPGDYLIRRSDDSYPVVGYENTSYSHGGFPAYHQGGCWPDNTWPGGPKKQLYQGIVNVPTTYATMLIRLFVLQNTTDDLNTLHTYQNASIITPVNRTVTHAPAPSGDLSSLAPNGSLLGIDTPALQLEFAGKFLPYNQPENYTDRDRVSGILGQAGIYGGAYHPPSGVNLTEAALIANGSITADLSEAAHIRYQSNGWQLPITEYQGNYGLNYAPRAYVAIAGYQQQTARQTLYPGYKNIGFTSTFTLANGTALLVTFSGRPLLEKSGFWSLAVYGADQYLIQNDLNRFEVGDRTTSLVFENGGGLVYGANANSQEDGPFQVLVQPANTPPPSNWTGNWLPAAQSFSFILRWYVPQPAMTNGTYIYPVIEIINAIV